MNLRNAFRHNFILVHLARLVQHGIMAAADASEWKAVGRLTGERLHVNVGGRFVSVIRTGRGLFCVDSTCYHSGGPIALGDLEEVNGELCIKVGPFPPPSRGSASVCICFRVPQ